MNESIDIIMSPDVRLKFLIFDLIIFMGMYECVCVCVSIFRTNMYEKAPRIMIVM